MLEQGIENDLARKVKLEQGLLKVRWFGIAFAFFQIFSGKDPLCIAGQIPVACEPSYLRPIGYGMAAGLLVVNLLATAWVRRHRHDGRHIQIVGLALFLIDHLFLIGYTWLYSAFRDTTTWVMLYILPLEGALRYGMTGALASLGILGVAETARDIYREKVFGYPFVFVPGTTFRIGIMSIIGMVAGMMSRSLNRERQEVERRADLMSDLADREAAARREANASYEAVRAGVSTGNFQEAMERMITTIGENLGLESLALGLVEETKHGRRLRVVAGHRYPAEAIGKSIALDEGICGPVVATGTPALVNDVEADPRYLDWATWAKSEMAVPLRAGGNIIGVLNVESPNKDAFDIAQLEKLNRVAAQVAVVVENARVLAKEQEAVHRLTELDTMKTDFIAITSHELRTPLTVIRGFIQTLRRSDVDFSPDQRQNYLEVIDRQTTRLHQIVEDLLFVARIESGAIDLQHSSVNPKQLLEEVIEEGFSDRSGQFVIEGDGAGLITDRDRLKRVCSNLIENALKFSPEGSVISLTLRDTPDHLQILVRDSGVGIPKEELERIFDRFHQVGGSLRRESQGFGLGLYVVRRIVEAIGGTIDVTSAAGAGTTFTISLPKNLVPHPGDDRLVL